MSLWSGVGGQLLSHHVAVVRGCCHVGGQLRTRSLEEPFRGAFRKKRRFLFIKEVLIHSHFQQPFLAAILPSSSQLPFLPHQPLLSSSSAALLSGSSRTNYSHYVAVVRGWWSALDVAAVRG